jgi:ribosome-associated protein
MLPINKGLTIPESEIQVSAIRAQGPGGQNVNKVSNAVHLRFDIIESSLPESVKRNLIGSNDYRINRKGVVVIKAQRFRSREKNLEDARERLRSLIESAQTLRKPRRKTKPPQSVNHMRLQQKTHRGEIKRLRSKVSSDD